MKDNFKHNLLVKANDLSRATKSNWGYILAPELKKDIDDGEKYFLLDIRRPEDYASGHIKGAVNIFWLELFDEKKLKKLPKKTEIIIICYVGHTASQILSLLKLLGYKVRVLKFGMGKSPVADVKIAGWLDFGFETVRD